MPTCPRKQGGLSSSGQVRLASSGDGWQQQASRSDPLAAGLDGVGQRQQRRWFRGFGRASLLSCCPLDALFSFVLAEVEVEVLAGGLEWECTGHVGVMA